MPQPVRIALLLFVAVGVGAFVVMLFWRAFRRAEDPVRLAVKWLVTFAIVGWIVYEGWHAQGAARLSVLIFVVLPSAVVLVILWARPISELFAAPFANMFTGGSEEPDPAPLYSIAEALRKRGKFREAIYAIQEQLQKFPTDFAGQIMLAEIQAENLNELDAAGIAIHRLCEQEHPPAQIAFALNSLADWQLRYAQDVDSARNALHRIIELFPETEFARTASQRIAHLAEPDMLLKLREPGSVVMKPGVEYLSLLKDQSHLLPKETPVAEQIDALVAQLEAHPLDHEARERLAVLYAQEYGHLDLATEQLEQLIALPGESPKHVAR